MFADAFPFSKQEDISKVMAIIPLRTYNNIKIGKWEKGQNYTLNGVLLRIPSRIYYTESSNAQINQLNEHQRMILHCIYSRSCDGFVREKHIKSLLSLPDTDWTIPFIVKICDEYVIEILETVFEQLHNKNTDQIKAFCVENKSEFCKSYARMTSYWNEYYRGRYHRFKDYVGYKLFKECFGHSRATNSFRT